MGTSQDASSVIAGLLIILVIVAFVAAPVWKIIRKAGYSGWWALLYFVPLVNIVMLWVFAFSYWPNLAKRA
jgi:uncharacterized membrane protein YhaH (DUF805 family)